ncbi:TlpA disulfide reductase family protein [uncultured Planktosalinus sp.]|uniref:TlpA disulfide reductase family protein n=1 Tax=uncultured Planktosalinus sp. TaxID=1810935 RepID=UPI0030D97D1D
MYLKYCLIFIVLISCKEKNQNQVTSEITENEKSIPVYDFDGFEPMLHKQDDITYIINFWATWCKPCIKELPYFEKINIAFKELGVEVILVSLDFPEKLESQVQPFIEKHQLKSQVVLLDDVDSNTWIPKVSESWSGAIPATLIYNRTQRKFYEGSFTYDELLTELKPFLK